MDLKKNYGNNISISFCRKNYIIGNKFNVCLVITMSIIFTLIITFWILLLYNTISKFIFFIGIILYILLIYNYLKSFFTEPGIIPRNYYKYILNKEKRDNTIDSEDNLFKIIDNRSRSTIALDMNETGFNNLEQTNEKDENKIFPDFILAESNEDLKANNENIKNSINEGYNNEIINENEKKDVYIYNKKYKINENNNNKSGNIIKHLKENNNNEYIPHIFTNRPCNTCNIIRPPKTSHCVICDDCIMEMDHHCFYISNCVGIRNRKYFVFFLFYGFLLSLLCIITSSYHLIFSFFIKNENKKITKLLFIKYYIPISISFILIIISILILLLKKESIKISCIFFIPGNILFDIFFYINKKKYISIFNNLEYHPFSISLIYSILPMFIFVNKYLKRQIKLIGKNLTTKQYMSIKEERNKNKNNRDIYNYLDSILQRKIDFKNIYIFLFFKKKKSLINI